MVLPILVALTVALVWVLSLGVAQVRVVDAARETARALARDEADATARSLGQRVAPDGATIAVTRDEGSVVVVVTSEVQGPGGLLRALPGATVRAEAVAAVEAP